MKSTIPAPDTEDGKLIGLILFISGFGFLALGIIALIWLSRR